MQLAYKRTRKRIDARKEAQTQDRIRIGFERSLSRKMINYFSSLSIGASKALEQNGTMGFDVYMAETRPKVARILEPHWYDVIKTFGDRSQDYILRKELYNGFYQELLEKFTMRIGANHISDIDDTSRKQLRRVIFNGQKDGLPLPQIAKNIRERYSPKFSRARAATIARTETHSAASFANHQVGMQYAKTQPAMQKQWIAINDDRTREAHRIANGQIVNIDSPFIVGGRPMEYTGDPNGGAANVINCRCAVIYIEPDDDVFDNSNPPIAPLPLPNPAPRAINSPLRLRSLGSIISIPMKTGPLRGKSQAEIVKMYDKKLRDALTPVTEKVYNNVPLPKRITTEGTTAEPKGYYGKYLNQRTKETDNKLVANLEKQTLEHEYGHHIDYTTSNSSNVLKAWSESDKAFKDAFKLDRANLNELPPSKLISFRQELYITERIKSISPKTGRELTVLNATNKVQKEGYELVSDIVDAMSAGRFQDNFSAWGHGVNYYKKSGMIYKETYANLFALQNNKEALAYIDKYFPNVSTVFKKRMLELAKDN